MKFTSTIISLAALFSVASAETVRHNPIFDNAWSSLNTVACSNGAHGLVDKFPTFGSLPSFPNIGSGFAVGNWHSPKCGSCWKLTYKYESIYLTAIDTISAGFEISLDAMNTLTNGKAGILDSIDVEATEVNKKFCK
jgi:hypothetical protein